MGAAAGAGRAFPPVQEVLGSRGDHSGHKPLLQELLPSSAEPSWPAGSGTGIVGNKRMGFGTVQGRAGGTTGRAKVWEERRGEREVS